MIVFESFDNFVLAKKKSKKKKKCNKPKISKQEFMQKVIGTLENEKLEDTSSPFFQVSQKFKNKKFQSFASFEENKPKRVLVCYRDDNQSNLL